MVAGPDADSHSTGMALCLGSGHKVSSLQLPGRGKMAQCCAHTLAGLRSGCQVIAYVRRPRQIRRGGRR